MIAQATDFEIIRVLHEHGLFTEKGVGSLNQTMRDAYAEITRELAPSQEGLPVDESGEVKPVYLPRPASDVPSPPLAAVESPVQIPMFTPPPDMPEKPAEPVKAKKWLGGLFK